MTSRPIIFSTPMVRAILEGRKTQTRRIVQPLPSWKPHSVCKPEGAADPWAVWFHFPETERVGHIRDCPYGKTGDRLWVRECFHVRNGSFVYRASEPDNKGPWHPSIHMPRSASRITLEIVRIKVERLQHIGLEDVQKEGLCFFPGDSFHTMRATFAQLWNKLNYDRGFGWEANPWVWVVEFKATQEGVSRD